MTISSKLNSIRKKLGISESTVALNLGYHINKFIELENGEATISNELLSKWKLALGIPEVPITDVEVQAFEESLWNWRTLINSWLVDLAREGLHKLKRCAELSCEPHLQHVYTLISIGYFSIVDDNEAADRALQILAVDYLNLSTINKIRFHTIRGNRYANKHNYAKAFEELHEAYILNDGSSIAGLGLYYALAQCLTVFGFSYKAIDLLTKTREMYKAAGDEVTLIYSNIPLALNYSRIGEFDKAMQLLNESLDQQPVTSLYPSIYYGYANLYKAMGDYDKALEFCEKTIESIDLNSEIYLNALYLKAEIFTLQNNTKPLLECIEEGLTASINNYRSLISFNTIKHMRNLNNEESLSYIINTSIPFFEEEKYYRTVIEYNLKLCEYFEKCGNHSMALNHLKQSMNYEQKLSKGDIS
ncbi:MAG: tetratricopeptide repeat protein [Defluviitaleaceae bacterium]|nr:tetratricopeptide repeat protein [Defluviitaleaceae bacterium]